MKPVLLAAVVALAAGSALAQANPPHSCRQYWSAAMACAHGPCNHTRQERLKRQCLRDGGRPRPTRRPDIDPVATGERHDLLAPDDR